MHFQLLISNCRQIVCLNSSTGLPLRNVQLDVMNAKIAPDTNDGLSIVVASDGVIHDIDYDSVITQKYKNDHFESRFDGSGLCVLPGLVDAHTHPVWAGDRVHEYAMKLAGASYMDVHAAGGGIHFTVDKTREATFAQLKESLLHRCDRMIRQGTTLLEAKSGYGLNLETELKMLQVIDAVDAESPMEISSTYCGAHAVPKNLTTEEYTSEIVENHLPEIAKEIKNGLSVENIDVFCEKNVFSVDQTRRIVSAGGSIAGLAINFHGDELFPTGSAELAGELGARAVSHLEEISDQGISAIATSKTAAVILPTTAYILQLPLPPVKKMIDRDVIVALGSDFNPNAYCYSMPVVMNLACNLFRISLPQALVAATLNSAASLGRASSHGSIQVGKFADLLLIDAPSWEHLIYQLGCSEKLICCVVKKGKVIYRRERQETGHSF